jgi:hypothetical protein
VRFHRTTKNQFTKTIDVPGELIENEEYYTLAQQLIGAGTVGISAGVLLGYFASLPWHVDNLHLTSEIIVSSALGGWVVSWGWLAKERAWQLGKALPVAINEYLALADGRNLPDDNVIKMEFDHRFRDGHTESGRTIQYFGTLPVPVEAFNKWAQDALRGDSLAIAHWIGPGKPFSRNEYDRLLNQLRQSGTIVNQPGKGHLLTGGGRRAIAQHLKSCGITPPYPADAGPGDSAANGAGDSNAPPTLPPLERA